MGNFEEKYSDLHEITLWQQLNKQLIQRRNLGEPVTDDKQRAFQKFCFDNHLFHRITEDPLIDEIPLGFVSDFDNINILTFYIKPWAKCLTSLLSNTTVLNVEQAQADAFDAMTKLENKHRIFDKPHGDIDLDDDEELYSFIDEYNSLAEKQGRGFCEMLSVLYELKGRAVNRVINEFGGDRYILLDGGAVLIDYHSSEDKDQISAIYRNDFCVKGLKKISGLAGATGAGLDMEILGLLDSKMSEPYLRSSIQQFIQHERNLIQRQSKLLKEFFTKLNTRINSADSNQIKVAELSLFSFLKSPYPAV